MQRYYKMLGVGVPKGAVQAKMTLEGLDASVLDNPDALFVTPLST